MVSLEFFNKLILPAALWSWGVRVCVCVYIYKFKLYALYIGI
jgi:hypothetical protein